MTTPMTGPHAAYPAVSSDDRSMALLAHLSTIAAMLLSAGWLSFAGPLILWAIYKGKSPFVRASAAGAFNFNLSMWAMSVIGWICVFTIVLAPLGGILIAVSFLAQIVLHVRGAMVANRGELYRYPMTFVRILS